jgi:hypothetical protein
MNRPATIAEAGGALDANRTAGNLREMLQEGSGAARKRRVVGNKKWGARHSFRVPPSPRGLAGDGSEIQAEGKLDLALRAETDVLADGRVEDSERGARD